MERLKKIEKAVDDLQKEAEKLLEENPRLAGFGQALLNISKMLRTTVKIMKSLVEEPHRKR